MGDQEKQNALEMVNNIEAELAVLPVDVVSLPLQKRLCKERDYWLAIAKKEELDAGESVRQDPPVGRQES